MASSLMTLWALAASATTAGAGAASPTPTDGLHPMQRLEQPSAATDRPGLDGRVLVAQSTWRQRKPKRKRRQAQQQEQEQQQEAQPEDAGLGLDLSQDTAQQAEPPVTEQAQQLAVEQEPSVAGEEVAAPEAAPLRFRLGAAFAPGAMPGLPNTLAGGALRLRAALGLLPWLEVGLSAGGGEWARMGERVENAPYYDWLGTLEGELLVRAQLGAPFVEAGVGARVFNVESERRGYLSETGPLMGSLGAGYTFAAGPLPLDLMLRLSAMPGTRTFYGLEAQAVLWVF